MNSPQLGALLARWEESRRSGKEVSPQELCPDNPRQAEALSRCIVVLRGLDRAEEVTLAAPSLPDDATLPPAAAQVSPPGKAIVSGYELIEELGRGGMGVVYKARHVKLNRIVALKMILAGGHAGEADLARFRTEAEAIARLQHPGIVQVFEVGEQDGKPFLSLEFCDGGSLDSKLAGTPLPAAEAAALVRKLAEAVQVAHVANVLHRDLKPANVLLTANGTPKVTDFGLAKKLDEQGQTQTGSIMGTPSYMAPEQAEGKKDTGPAADIYALGAILYECLTGRPPFRAATAFDTILQVVSEEPVAPSRLNAKVPPDLDAVTLKCLEKDPKRRYGSAADLADDLERYLSGEPTNARPPSGREIITGWLRRNLRSAICVLGSGVLVGLLIGAAGYLVMNEVIYRFEQGSYGLLPRTSRPWLLTVPRIPRLVSGLLALAFLILAGMRGLLVILLVRPRNTAGDLSHGLAVGLVSGLIALFSGLGWFIIGGECLRTVNNAENYLAFSEYSLNSQKDAFPAQWRNNKNVVLKEEIYPPDWHFRKHPDLANFPTVRHSRILYNKLLCDAVVSVQTGLVLFIPFFLLLFVLSPSVEAITAGTLWRRNQGVWTTTVGYAERMLLLTTTVGYGCGMIYQLFLYLSFPDWLSRFQAEAWHSELAIAFLILAQVAVWRKWYWPIRLLLHALWVTAMLYGGVTEL